jgi:hypothetical protein
MQTMKPENEKPNNQFNVATEQRNAARDYFESTGIGSINVALATWTPERLDETSQFNPNLFASRFGFSGTGPVRSQVIAFQRKYDLLDNEIWWLRRAGHIQVTRTGIKIDISALMPILGLIQVALFSLMIVLMFLQVEVSSAPEWKKALGYSGVGIFGGAMLFVLIKLYIVPWRTLSECGAIKDEQLKKVGTQSNSIGQ